MNKKLKLVTKLGFKISYYGFGYRKKLVTKNQLLNFRYQNDLVTKLVSN